MQTPSVTPKLALYTFGLFIEEDDHPANDSFWELNDRIFPVVDACHGLIGRSGYENEEGPESWGKEVYPRFAKEHGRDTAPSTISLWESIEAAMAFAYFGLHSEALKRGREWNLKPKWPPYAVWWWRGCAPPDWTEAVRRHEFLHDNGPTPDTFNFKVLYSPSGDETTLDRDEVKRIAAINASRL